MKLYLIPTPIGDSIEKCQPPYNREVINSLDYFIVENLRSARRFLAPLKLDRTIDEMTFVELNKHTEPAELVQMVDRMVSEKRSCGLLSEAGLPCVADPGADVVSLAHRRDIEIVPLVGASSIMLALMASGANGQSFAFNGYLPIKERNRAIKQYESMAHRMGQTQIFIETPYRNDKLLEELLRVLSESTRLSVAVNLNAEDEWIRTLSVAEWRKQKGIVIGKRPAIFIIF